MNIDIANQPASLEKAEPKITAGASGPVTDAALHRAQLGVEILRGSK